MKVGYARVSKAQDQRLDAQYDALNRFGCEKIFEDKASGATDDRPGFKSMMEFVRTGDVVCIFKLDRISRSVSHLISIAEELKRKGVELQSVHEHIDTCSPGGKLFFHLLAAFAAFERDTLISRTRAGLEAASARGRLGGRPTVVDNTTRKLIISASKNGTNISSLARKFNISRATCYRVLHDNLDK